MWEFNLVVTMSGEGLFGRLMAELEPHGEFHKTPFLGVVLGMVEETETFLGAVRRAPERFADVGRVIPVERIFTFRADDFIRRASEAIGPYVPCLAGKRFYVRLERRGLKGRIVSPEAEREMDAFIEEALAAEGHSATVDFERPDAVVAVETVGDRGGVALLTRELMERYPFVRAD